MNRWVPKVFLGPRLADTDQEALRVEAKNITDTILGLGFKVELDQKVKTLSAEQLSAANMTLREVSEALYECKAEVGEGEFNAAVQPSISTILLHTKETGQPRFTTDSHDPSSSRVTPKTLHVFLGTTRETLKVLFEKNLVAVARVRAQKQTIH